MHHLHLPSIRDFYWKIYGFQIVPTVYLLFLLFICVTTHRCIMWNIVRLNQLLYKIMINCTLADFFLLNKPLDISYQFLIVLAWARFFFSKEGETEKKLVSPNIRIHQRQIN